MTMSFTKYTIYPGNKNFDPSEPIWPFRASGFSIACRLTESCWWSPEDWEGDRDRADWNKLKGITYAFSANNKCSAMIAWRPGKLENVFEITAYTNDRHGGWTVTGTPVEVYAGEVFYCSARVYDDAVRYEISYYGNINEYTHPFRRPWLKLYRETGTWIGGENNEPGPYGGRATQNMVMWIDFQRRK